jgi:hypothetical protein
MASGEALDEMLGAWDELAASRSGAGAPVEVLHFTATLFAAPP